jgi:hypothetical protein
MIISDLAYLEFVEKISIVGGKNSGKHPPKSIDSKSILTQSEVICTASIPWTCYYSDGTIEHGGYDSLIFLDKIVI